MKKQLLSLIMLVSVSASAANFDTEIAARQDAYNGIQDNVKAAGGMLKSGEFDYTKLEMLGETLSMHSSSLKTLFPEGSQEGSNAKKAVWTSMDDFTERLNKLDQGFQDFYAGAKAQDQAMLVAGFKDATSTCKGCHRKYRNKK
ncbi:c-type cytochrome [Vibrio sp. MA40-2]|uniref:c-type cytochrome n=1 Tax=Vibrio sp. MA40-2 TaxID=3391828 RepID=UPI0039A600AC